MKPKKNRGLVHVPASVEEGTSADEGAVTLFGQFFAALASKQPKEQRVLAGSAAWSGLPLEEIVFDGLWAVMGAVADRYRFPFVTDRDIWEGVAPRVNRLVSAGLLLSYSTMDEAAIDFWKEVCSEIASKLKGLPPDQGFLPQSLWQQASMRFFARLFKRARDEGERIRALHASLIAINQLRHDKIYVSYLVEGDLGLDGYLYYAELVDPTYDPMNESRRPKEKLSLGEVAAEMECLKVRLTDLARLPVRIRGVRDLAHYAGSLTCNIEHTWIETQLLLAAGHGPDVEEVDIALYMAYREQLRDQAPEEVIATFWARMEARGASFSKASRERMHEHLLGRINAIKARPLDPSLVSMDVFAYVNLSLEMQLTPYMALECASGDDYRHVKLFEPAQRVRFMHESVAPRLQWEALSEYSLQKIVQARLLSTADLVTGLLRVPDRPLATSLVAFLLRNYKTIGTDEMERLLTADLVSFTVDLAIDHFEDMTDARLLAVIPTLIHEASQYTRGDRTKAVRAAETFVQSVLRLREQIIPVVTSLEVRAELYDVIFDFLVDPGARGNHLPSLTKHRFNEFCKALTYEVWWMFLLMIEIHFREPIYAGKGKEADPGLDDVPLAPWQELGSVDSEKALSLVEAELHLTTDVPSEERLLRKRFKSFVTSHDEDEVFSWYHLGRPDLAQRLVTYRANRAQYYAEWQAKLAAASSKKTPTQRKAKK